MSVNEKFDMMNKVLEALKLLEKDKPKTEEKKNSNLEEEEYTVDRIVGRRVKRGQVYYQVKYEDYDQITWEPESKFENLREFIWQYEEEHGPLSEEEKAKLTNYSEKRNGRIQAEIGKDLPREAVMFNTDKGERYFIIQWKQRECGEVPKRSKVPYEIIKTYYSSFLIEYFEKTFLQPIESTSNRVNI